MEPDGAILRRVGPRVMRAGPRPVAVVLSRFPTVTETFILREVTEMERQGQPVRLVPLLRESPPVVHPAARPWVERALYTPFLSLAIIAANLAVLARSPGRYLGLLARLVRASVPVPRFLLNTLAIFPKSVYLARRLEREGIRHVHAHFGSHPATAAHIISALSDIDYSVTLHAHDLFVPSYRPYLGAKLAGAAFVRVISDFNRRYLLEHYPEVEPDRVHVIHVGIPADHYAGEGAGKGAGEDVREDAGAPVREPGGGDGAVRVVTVAGLRPYKGIPVLLEACRLLLDEGVELRCRIVGDGPDRSEIEALHQELDLGDRVQLLGALPEEEVRTLLQERPIFALPSVILEDGWMEGIPVALMEAMAAGCPVVASRLSGIPELVEHERTGLLTEPGDADGLAAAIRRIADTPDLAERVAVAGREKVRQEFELTTTVTDLLERVRAYGVAPEDRVVEVLDRLRDRFPGAGLEPTDVRAGPDAVVAELTADGSGLPPRLILKIHREVPGARRGARARARREYDVLRELGTDPEGPDHEPCRGGVPWPLHFDPAGASVLMEACRGRPLSALVRRGRWGLGARQDRLERAVEEAGRLLSDLHTRSRSRAREEEARRLWWADVEADLERCAPLLSPALLERARSSLQEGRQRLADGFMPVYSHGDFWPGNVLVARGSAATIDLEGARDGLPCEDIGYFLAQLELFFDYPLLRRRYPRFRDAFLRGYGLDADGPELAACRVSKILQILARSDGPGWRRGRRRRRLRRLLTRALP